MKTAGSVLALVVIGAVLALAPLAWAADVQGKVKSVDPAGRMVTLDDGTQIVIPANLKVQRKDLKPGADVKASYEEQNGQKVATSIVVMPAR